MPDVPDGACSPPSSPRPSAPPACTATPGYDTLEERITQLENELGEVCGVLQQLANDQEGLARSLRQQRWGRYLVWGTVIAVLAILWFTMRARYPL
jgi:hypothetical protein